MEAAANNATQKIITRAEAKAAGLKTFFTGKPCKRGHVVERHLSGGQCVECNRANAAAWKAANPERHSAHNAAWYAANPERARANRAAWVAANADRIRSAGAAWRAANADRIRATKAAYYEANADRKRATNAAWRAANPERARAATAAWSAANPEKVSAHYAKRRARKLAAIPTSIDQAAERKKIAKLYAAAKRLEALTGFAWQVDHRVPLARGGLHVSSNLQLIPALLNLRKGDKLMYVEPFSWVADAQAEPALALPWLTAQTSAAA